MSSLKILHVYKSYYPETQGGVERVIQMLSSETAKMDCQNRLITCSDEKKFHITKNDILDVYYYPTTIKLASSPFSYALWKAFPEHLKWADVIHYHFPWPMADLLHCTWGVKKPSIITYHSDVVRQKYLKYLYQPLMYYFLNRVDCIVPTSQNYVNSSVVLKNYSEKISVIPIGIDPTHYEVTSEKQKIWQEKLPQSFILFVGVLRYYKGVEYLLEALDGTLLEGKPIPLVIAGGGPLLEELKNQAKRLTHTEIIFTGALEDEDLCAIYSLAQALVIPASHRSEAYCIALVEGLRFGLPLISTEIGTGTSFVNASGETGFVVPACEPASLKKAILSLMQDKALRSRMGKASCKRFDALFTSQKMAKAYLAEYQSIL